MARSRSSLQKNPTKRSRSLAPTVGGALALVSALSVSPTIGAEDESGRVTYIVSIQHVDHAADELIGWFHIDVHCGDVTSMSGIPRDWYVTLDNMTNCETTVQGSAIHGAAALSEKELGAFKLHVTKNEGDGLVFGLSGQVSVTKDFESERRVELTASDFIVEDPSRDKRR